MALAPRAGPEPGSAPAAAVAPPPTPPWAPGALPGSWLDAGKAKEAQDASPPPLGHTDCLLGIISWQMGQTRACPPCPRIPLESIWGSCCTPLTPKEVYL